MKAVLPFDTHAGENGSYKVTSLYFDDIYYTAYNQKISGAENRAKFRLRCYNQNEGFIVMECKIKHGEYIAKDSAILSKDEYGRILRGDCGFALARSEPVMQEFYKQCQLKGLRPVAQVDYMRKVFAYPHGNVRVTIDTDIRASLERDLFNKTAVSFPALNPDMAVLELKYDNFLPSVVHMLLTGVNLVRQPVSKYVLCADKIMEVSHHVK